jgi:tight adherence protein B
MVQSIGLLIGLAVIAAFVGIYHYAQQAQEVQERFDGISGAFSTTASQDHQESGRRDRLDRWLAGANFSRRSRARLARANVKLTLTEYMLLRVGVTGVAFLIGLTLSKSLIGGALLGVLASSLPNAYVSRLQSKRQKAFQDQLPDVLSLLVNSLRAGHGLLQAVNLVTQEMPEPTREEFGRVRREINLGLPMNEALHHLVDRMQSDDLELMVTAISVQHEVGGNLAEILATIGEVIRERIRILGDVRTMTAQQRMVGTVLAGLPFLLGTGLMMINPDYMKGLFDPGLPRMLAAGAVVMVIMGYILMQKLLQIDV